MMTMTKIALFVLLCITCWGAEAQTIKAASCSVSDVQTALNAVTSSTTTVSIPAGTCTWTTGATLTVPSGSTSLSVIGQTSCSGTTASSCTDNTVIIDNVSHSPTDNPTLTVTTGNAGSSFRLSGITFEQSGSSSATYAGLLRISGYSQAFRMDNIHFHNVSLVDADIDGWMYGVIDHSLFDLQPGTVTNGVRVGMASYNNDQFGDGSWADNTNFGQSSFIYFENNTFNGGAAEDCNNGGKIVFRYNQLNESFFQGHEMEDRNRGCRAVEVYQNTFNNSSGSILEDGQAVDFRTGTGLVWGNIATGAMQLVIFNNDRTNTGHVFYAPPNGWGYCGTVAASAAGQTSSSWDQNPSASSGYACIDQVGRGKGNLLPQSYWPVTATWPANALEPVYEWLDKWTPVPGYSYTVPCNTNDSNTIAANRDYYCHTQVWNGSAFAGPAFDGTVGVGSGTFAARPTTCSTGVAYWATDQGSWNQSGTGGQGQLYKCTITNTWTLTYTPFTYPHPLEGTSTAGTPPPSPVDLTGSAQ